MRVLTIASEAPPIPSGVARSVGEVVSGLRHLGHDVDVVTSTDAWRRHFGEIRLSALARRWARLEQLVNGYELVQLHGPAPMISETLLARWRVARHDLPPLVYTHHFSLVVEGLPGVGPLYDTATKRLLGVPDVVVTTTSSYAELVRPWARDTRVIAWGAPEPSGLERIEPYDGSRPMRVLFIGQQRPYKGVGRLVDAAAELEQVSVTIIGKGPQLEKYQARAAQLPNVTHLGGVDDAGVAAAIADHDVICLPSTNRSEAFGLVLLEGMVGGCVPVASDLDGVRDVVGDGGLLVTPGDAMSLRHALVRLAGDPDLLALLASRAARHVVTFTWDATVAAYATLYEELAGRGVAKPQSSS